MKTVRSFEVELHGLVFHVSGSYEPPIRETRDSPAEQVDFQPELVYIQCDENFHLITRRCSPELLGELSEAVEEQLDEEYRR